MINLVLETFLECLLFWWISFWLTSTIRSLVYFSHHLKAVSCSGILLLSSKVLTTPNLSLKIPSTCMEDYKAKKRGCVLGSCWHVRVCGIRITPNAPTWITIVNKSSIRKGTKSEVLSLKAILEKHTESEADFEVHCSPMRTTFAMYSVHKKKKKQTKI